MSWIHFDAHTQQHRVVIPPVKRLPPNPHIGGPGVLARALAPPSETDSANSEWPSESQMDKGLRHELLASDQRSFLTGSVAADLQASYILNVIRNNPGRKRNVESFLTQQKIHAPILQKFYLDAAQNAILLEASFHTQWNLYGTFCFVPSETDALAMLDELRASNKTWIEMQHAMYYGSVARPLDVSKPPFARPCWDIVILHPDALLPENQPLAMANNRCLYKSRESSPFSTPQTWNLWIASADHLSSLQQPSVYLNPFKAIDLRGEFGVAPLASLAMVINAHSKLEKYMQEYSNLASERVKRFEKIMSQLVTEIFFVPPGQLPSPWTADIEAVDPMASDNDSVEGPEIADTDGLTNSEFQLLSSKATDSHLGGKERADAAMMMIFGTHHGFKSG